MHDMPRHIAKANEFLFPNPFLYHHRYLKEDSDSDAEKRFKILKRVKKVSCCGNEPEIKQRNLGSLGHIALCNTLVLTNHSNYHFTPSKSKY